MVIKPHLEREEGWLMSMFSDAQESIYKCPAIARVVDNAGPLPWKTMSFLRLFQIQLWTGQKLDMFYVCFSGIHALGPDSQRVLIIEEKRSIQIYLWHDFCLDETQMHPIWHNVIRTKKNQKGGKLVLALKRYGTFKCAQNQFSTASCQLRQRQLWSGYITSFVSWYSLNNASTVSVFCSDHKSETSILD